MGCARVREQYSESKAWKACSGRQAAETVAAPSLGGTALEDAAATMLSGKRGGVQWVAVGGTID